MDFPTIHEMESTDFLAYSPVLSVSQYTVCDWKKEKGMMPLYYEQTTLWFWIFIMFFGSSVGS